MEKRVKILGQRLSDGSVEIITAPDPNLPAKCVRVRTLYSAISPGTEGGKIITGKKSLIGKAKAKPEQAMQAIQMVKSLGLQNTIRKVRSKLEGAQPLGYSTAGEIIEIGNDVTGFEIGDQVACAGGGYANHADQTVIPVNLTVKIPSGVSPDTASFATLGAIALQGIRIAAPTVGETAVVIGLGIIGQLACQILKSNGCRVAGVDISGEASALALKAGSAGIAFVTDSDSVEAGVSDFTRGRGADLVIVCAGTSSNQPIELAGRITRKKGRVVVVGAVGMDIPREPYYRKEISFTVSCSYGPGRYDPLYEEGGYDYPAAYVRWTEGRNLEAILDLMASGGVDPLKLITHRREFDKAPELYELIGNGAEYYCGMLLSYPNSIERIRTVDITTVSPIKKERIGIGFFGAGSFAQTFLIPPLKQNKKTYFSAICTQSGLTAAATARKQDACRAVATLDELVSDKETDAIVVSTRHDMHAPAVIECLKAGKAVFVEKPLCLTTEQLTEIASILKTADKPPLLQVGFNRRFSKAAVKLKKYMGVKTAPLCMMYRVNAGHIPKEHWIQGSEEGGGRIIGEVCHFIDLMQFFCEALPVEVFAKCISSDDSSLVNEDNVIITLRFSDGSIGSVSYFSEGSKSMPKERFEVLGAGNSGVIDNFNRLEFYGNRKRTGKFSGKGHAEEMSAFISALSSGNCSISPESLISTTLATFITLKSLESGNPEVIDIKEFIGD